jgi:hypothetical protein
MSYKENIIRNISNIPGWRTKNKYVVFESDDWGSKRMTSMLAFEKLEKLGLDLRSCDAERYNRNDTLAKSSDLENLFDILSAFTDRTGNNPVFTVACVVANPDFEKIREAEYSEYFYEAFTDTLKRTNGCERSFELWLEGIRNKIFVPQLHGREHLNVNAWMKALRNNDRQTKLAFNEGIWGFVPNPKSLPDTDFQAAFQLAVTEDLEFHKKALQEGLDLFEKIFNYRAEYFVPPNGIFNNTLNLTLRRGGVKYRSAAKVQYESVGAGRTKKTIHWLGQKEKNGIRYISRNCFFEPSQPGRNWVDSCLNDINIAFRWQKPAIISTHRVNYISGLNPMNRDVGLSQLKLLFHRMTTSWPDLVFLTTPELGKLMDNNFDNE